MYYQPIAAATEMAFETAVRIAETPTKIMEYNYSAAAGLPYLFREPLHFNHGAPCSDILARENLTPNPWPYAMPLPMRQRSSLGPISVIPINEKPGSYFSAGL